MWLCFTVSTHVCERALSVTQREPDSEELASWYMILRDTLATCWPTEADWSTTEWIEWAEVAMCWSILRETSPDRATRGAPTGTESFSYKQTLSHTGSLCVFVYRKKKRKKKLVYSQNPLGIITIIFVIDVVNQEVNRKWEEFSAVPNWCSSDQCLLEPSPTEDWQTERGKVRLLHCTTTTYITDNIAINHSYTEIHLDRQSKGRESVLEYNSSLLLIFKVLIIISNSNNYILTINLISDIWEHGEITPKEVWRVKKHEQADKTETQILPRWVFLLRYYCNW